MDRQSPGGLQSSLAFLFLFTVLSGLVVLGLFLFGLHYLGFGTGSGFILLGLSLLAGTVVGSLIGYLVLRLSILEHLRVLFQYDRAAEQQPDRLIPEEEMPPHELGRLMRSRNLALDSLNQMFASDATETLVRAVDAKDPYTRGHSHRVGQFARRMGEQAGENESTCEDLERAGILHDLGKIGIPDAVLTKEGPLTDKEFALIREHPERGERIITVQNIRPRVLDGVCYHHERYDGGGYPEGLEGENIPKFGRILAVADAVDAMLSHRVYRSGLTLEKTCAQLRENRGSQFDPRWVEQALYLLEQKPQMLPDFPVLTE